MTNSKTDHYVAQVKRLIEEHIVDFGMMLDAKESTAKHVQMTCRFVRDLAGHAGVETIRDLTPSAIQNALTQLREDDLSANGQQLSSRRQVIHTLAG